MLNQSNDFYVTLPSNGSKDRFPKNRGNSYKNQLAKEIKLDGDWEVALTEVHYPHSWNTLDTISQLDILVYRFDEEGDIKLEGATFAIPVAYDPSRMHVFPVEHLPYGTTKSIDQIKIYFDTGNYSNPQRVIQIFQWYIERTLKSMKPHAALPFKKLLELEFNAIKNKFVFIKDYKYIDLIWYHKDSLYSLLGLEPVSATQKYKHVELKNAFEVPHSPKLDMATTIYIYTDIIDDENVGDALVPLLRAIDVIGDKGETVNELFQRVYYKHVNRNNIQSIEIQLNSSTGDPIKFGAGNVICVLHFRRMRR